MAFRAGSAEVACSRLLSARVFSSPVARLHQQRLHSSRRACTHCSNRNKNKKSLVFWFVKQCKSQTFRSNVSPPFLGPRVSQEINQKKAGGKQIPFCCLAYSSNLKMEPICFSETSDFDLERRIQLCEIKAGFKVLIAVTAKYATAWPLMRHMPPLKPRRPTRPLVSSKLCLRPWAWSKNYECPFYTRSSLGMGFRLRQLVAYAATSISGYSYPCGTF
jgi:hypothetical protein